MRTFSLDFKVEGGYAVPSDPHLHQLAVAFAEQYLNAPINFLDYRKVLLTCQVAEDGTPTRALGLMCAVFKPDFPVVRFVDEAAGEKLFARARGWLEDEHKARGMEAFLFIADCEDEATRCPNWKQWLRKMGARKSQRWSVTI